ncbi:sulfotransferase domain-containing protein [Cyanobacterium aponinum UTEX 3222]|uniref:Sulfotransferase domain-containing protein n=1 Tax=Cyanobacterium aponinum 0216 TaxID=2676140 RepID=A0A844GUS1_9CHRO|nr:sulfotransferase domain-containing protein [Cyanobacterium aponinum]MBD2394115.1 sulfotransferase domain-containing protein [Cyanobacterium aponinum FACHB-4101]MTF38598.1 hypothetical protein [Cyanobacterium aponinum 0216]WRL38464.1 sulfotransferase domain-containing protein [Cyanobacterium aponinum UTEX 3221]WRL42056.1 sulfotransferase domain-containing protein [Cyanobacterium aponinum UTEX 3222]
MNLLIHIGYHKTGTTLLQKKIFNRTDFGFISPWTRTQFYEEIILANPFTYDPISVRNRFEQDFTRKTSENLIPVLSEERFSGNIVPKAVFNNYYIAERLYSLFPEAKILIIIRNQLDMILSIYKHRLRSNLTVDIDLFLEQIPLSTTFEPIFHLDYLQYHLLINHYQSLFGKDKVLCLPYEMLCIDSKSFFSQMSSFAGVNIDENLTLPKVNEGYSYLTLYIKRYINFLEPKMPMPRKDLSLINSLSWYLNQLINKTFLKNIGNTMESKLKKKIADKIEGYYQESNQKTSQLIGMDLSVYQYQI